MRVSTPLGDDTLLLAALSGRESVSKPFELVLDLLSENAAIDPTTLLHKPVVVTIDVENDTQRFFHGLVRRFVQLGRTVEFVSYRAEVVPSVWFLSLATDCRIFQQLSVPDIVKKVLGEANIEFQFNTTGTYPAREYCVQYRETQLDFVSRLLEEEGMFYFFEHTKEKHTMVIADGVNAVKAGGVAKLAMTYSTEGVYGDNVILELEVEDVVCTSKVILADYSELTPKTHLQSTVPSKSPNASSSSVGVFDYPGKFAVVDQGDRLARVRMEERESLGRIATGRTNCGGLASGQKLEIADHYRREFNQPYHLLSLEHHAELTEYRTGSGGSPAFVFESSFVAIPHATPYRPPRITPKSIVHGSQTATVVGPAGEEIYVDKYGRVKVQFFWDRVGKNDDASSCWVRVSSTWAGKGWGFIQIPRIGQEIIVDFLEGDPDRPIITGRVYNADMMPPYELPSAQTQSGLKTRSSKAGEAKNANELRFEDLKGSEQVYFHAEKDLSSVVENDELRDIKHDRTTTIKNNETKTIAEGNEAITIGKGSQTTTISEGDRIVTVDKGKYTLTIDQDRVVEIKQGNESLAVKTGNLTTEVSQGNHATKVSMGNVSLKAGAGSIAYEAMQAIELKVGGNSVKIDQTGITIKGLKVSIEGELQVEVKGLTTTVKGEGMLTLKGGITMIN
jgi:type VI secretion system secreted protein VgrG